MLSTFKSVGQPASSPDSGGGQAKVPPSQPSTGDVVTQIDAGGATNSPLQLYRVQVM